MRRLGAILTTAITLAACAPALAAAPGPVPRSWFGVTTEDVFAGDDAYRDATLTQQRGVGIGLIRQTFHWDQIEPSRDVYDFSAYDGYVARLASNGMQVMPLLFGEPAWASSRPATGPASGTYPPRDPSDMASFAATLVRRYGPGGSYWAAHPTIPATPIRLWQVWNEPNLPSYWPSGPDAAQYTTLLRTVSSAIHGVDAGATVLTAGLTTSNNTGAISRDDYLKAMYAAGARGAFNAVAVTRYGQDDSVVPSVSAVRSIMSANGDTSPIQVSETGWATDGPVGTGTVGEQGQAMDIKCSLIKLVLRRSDLKISGLIYYDWKDGAPYSKDFWGLHTGLLRLDGSRKPGYDAWAAATRDLQSPPAGNRTPRACFTSSDLRPYTGDKVTFTSTSVDPEGPIAGQAWDLRGTGTFADGTTYQTARTWTTPGTYLVSLRVADAAGATDVSTQEITVRNRPPVASYTVSPSAPAAGATVTFTSTSTDTDGSVASQAWDLDNDGSYDDGTAATATRTFATPGTYTVRLRVVDDRGTAATTSKAITVS